MTKLNLGCGGNILPGFENHDWDVDIEKRLPWKDNSIEFVFIEHCVEHVNGAKGYLFMEEALRILRPGGCLRICVPILDRLDRAAARDIIVNHGHQMVYNKQNLVKMLEVAGFTAIDESPFDPNMDGHWKVIGQEKDARETLRIVAFKL